jgi:DNA invertase Pin-like site-specific DNA recombinase
MGELKAAIYCRMSHESDNVRTQEQDCRDLCADRGWEVVGPFVDDGRSAWRNSKPRPSFLAMIQAIRDDHISALVVYNTDRLSRWGAAANELLELLRQRKMPVAQVDGTEYRTWTADGYHALYGQFGAAEHQSSRASERLQRKHRALAEAGYASGSGKRGYGYNLVREGDHATFEVVEEEAQVIRDCARRILDGESLVGVVRDLNSRGVKPVGGGIWRRQVLRDLLRSARISGQRELNGVLTKGVWEPILSPADTLRLRATFHPGAPRPRRHLLSGILRCGTCGSRMGSYVNNHSFRYLCRKDEGGCGSTSIAAPWVEQVVSLAVVEALPTLTREQGAPDDTAALQGITDAKGRVSEVAADFASGRVSRGTYLETVQAIEQRIADLERELTSKRRPVSLVPADGDVEWSTLDQEKLRAIISAVVERVDIAPVGRAKVGRDHRISVIWRA